MRDQELREQIRNALKGVQDLIRVAADGSIEYRLTRAVERVTSAVAPFIGEADAESRSLADRFDALVSEHEKAGESWDRQRERLERTIEELRGDLAEAVGMVKNCTGHPDSGLPSHFDLIQRAEASRRDWAAEAIGVREKLERLENLALNPGALNAGVLVGVGGEHDQVPSDEQCQRAAGLIERAIRRGMEPGYVTQAELRLLAAIEAPENVCSCITDDQAAMLGSGWSRPVCAVHPEGGGVE